MVSIRDLITDGNVSKTYNEGKYVCFVLRNGITVKLDPNRQEGSEEQSDKKETTC